MSTTLQFFITAGGNKAIWNQNNNGLSLDLTHVQVGTGNKEPEGDETALLSPVEFAPIASGFAVTDKQIRMSAIFTGITRYTIREVGIWAGTPGLPGSVLVCYWSQASGDLAEKSPGCDFVLTHDMVLDSSVPDGSLTVMGDSATSAMVMAHELKANPHAQYVSESTVRALIEARVGDYVSSTNQGNTYTVILDPAVTAYGLKTEFAFKASAANTGEVKINAGGGDRPLLRENGTPMAAGDVANGAVVTVVYDVALDAFLATDVVKSQMSALFDEAIAVHRDEDQAHPDYVKKSELEQALSSISTVINQMVKFVGSQTLASSVFTTLTLTPTTVDNELFSWAAGIFTVKKTGWYRFTSRIHLAVSQTTGDCSAVLGHVYTLGAGNSTVFSDAPSTYRNNQKATNYASPGGSSSGNSVFDISCDGATRMTAGDKFNLNVFTDSNAATNRNVDQSHIGKQTLIIQFTGK